MQHLSLRFGAFSRHPCRVRILIAARVLPTAWAVQALAVGSSELLRNGAPQVGAETIAELEVGPEHGHVQAPIDDVAAK